MGSCVCLRRVRRVRRTLLSCPGLRAVTLASGAHLLFDTAFLWDAGWLLIPSHSFHHATSGNHSDFQPPFQLSLRSALKVCAAIKEDGSTLADPLVRDVRCVEGSSDSESPVEGSATVAWRHRLLPPSRYRIRLPPFPSASVS